MIPPLGAMAIAGEPWPSREAEARIALAGPVFGFFQAVMVYGLWQLTRYPILEATVSFICYINMFNLITPIPILDGGRVIKSILFSINNKFGFAFYIFGFIFLLGAFLFVPTVMLLAVFIGYMLYADFNFYRSGPKMLAEARSLLEKLSNIEKQFHSEEVKAELIDAAFTKAGLGSVSDKNQKTLEEGIKRLELVASPLNMRPEAIVGYSLFFVGLNLAYLFLFSRLSSNFWKVLGMI